MAQEKSESKNLGSNKIFKIAESKNIFEVENVGHKNSIFWNHKDSEMIQVDPNYTELNKLIPAYMTKIGSISDLAYIHVIEKILSLPVHLINAPYLVPAPPIFICGIASDP